MTPIFEINAPDVIMDHSNDDIVLINLKNGLYYRISDASAQAFVALTTAHGPCVVEGITEGELMAFGALLCEKGLVRSQGPGPDLSNAGEIRDKLTLEEFGDLEDLLGLDPIHDVSPEAGWPVRPDDDV